MAGGSDQSATWAHISEIYKAVVAINDDTLYASAFVAATDTDPGVVTVPPTTDSYSVLQLDQYGTVFNGIPSNQPGIYWLTTPGWTGTVPPNVTQIAVPYNNTVIIFRADKYVKEPDANVGCIA